VGSEYESGKDKGSSSFTLQGREFAEKKNREGRGEERKKERRRRTRACPDLLQPARRWRGTIDQMLNSRSCTGFEGGEEGEGEKEKERRGEERFAAPLEHFHQESRVKG